MRRQIVAPGSGSRTVTDERRRIARELHDVVAHQLSVISIHAGLAKYVVRSDTETARTALDTIESLVCETLNEMRRILMLLRVGATDSRRRGCGEDAYHPAPSLADLPLLFERVRTAGVTLKMTVTGTPHPLPSGLDLCAFRVVQESLTNVLKHAAPTSAHVVLTYGSTTFSTRVTDDGPAGPPSKPRPRLTTGHGLIGMRERALICGGTLEAGPRHPRGFTVRLVLPTARVHQPPSAELS